MSNKPTAKHKPILAFLSEKGSYLNYLLDFM